MLSLLSTLIVLFCILKTLRPDLFPVDFTHSQVKFAIFFEGLASLEKLESSLVAKPESLVQQCLKAMTFCMNLNNEYPLIYSTLELGHSWEEVVAAMLEMHKEEASMKKLEETPAWGMWDKYSFTDMIGLNFILFV